MLAAATKANLMTWVKQHAPANTTRTYGTYSRQYLEFAEKTSLDPRDSVTVAAFMKSCIDRPTPLARSTVNHVIPSAIADLYRYENVSPTDNPLVKQVKKVVVRLTLPSKPKLPVTKAMLCSMACLVKPTEDNIRDMFMFILMFLGFLREDEITSLLHCS